MATIHRQEIKTGFLSRLGNSFLELLYRALIDSERAVCLVAFDKDEPAGYICGCDNMSGFYQEFYSKYFFGAALRVLPSLLRPGVAGGIYENLRRSRSDSSAPRAELVSLAVRNDWRGTGLAGRLLTELAQEFEQRGIKDFKVVVGSNLVVANAFYTKMGLIKVGTIETRSGTTSNIYEANVPDLIK